MIVGGGAEGGARRGRPGFLAYDDGGGQPFQAVHVGARWSLHEARVGFVDEPLRFGSDGVEDQRGLAGSGHAGDNGELALGDAHIHVLEVVFAGVGGGDEFLFYGSTV